MTTSPAAIYNRLQAIDRADMSAEARAARSTGGRRRPE